MKWSDLLRVKAEFPINLWPNAAQAYHRWIRTSIKENLPYDQFVRQMLTASGSNFRVPPVNFYRAMQNREPAGIAQTVALTFMGTRADKWPKDRLAGMAAFFTKVGYKSTAEWKEEIVFFDPGKTNAPATNEVAIAAAVFPDGAAAHLSPDQDPREVFADWLIDPKNPWFTQQHRQPRLGLAAGARHHPGAGRHPARQSALQSRAAGLAGAGADRQPLRPQAPLPADPELEDLPAFLHPEGRQSRGRCQFLALSPAPAGCGGAD